MDVVEEEVEYVLVTEKEVEEMVVSEAETEDEDEVTTPIHYLVHMVMELLFLKLRYMIKVNINHCPKIKKLKFKNSKVRLVGSMDIPCLMDIFYMTKDTKLYQQV